MCGPPAGTEQIDRRWVLFEFILQKPPICGFEVNEEMICVVSVFSHLLQDLPHGEDLNIY